MELSFDEAKTVSFLEKQIEVTDFKQPWSVECCAPVAVWYNTRRLSAPPDASRELSGDIAKQLISSSWTCLNDFEYLVGSSDGLYEACLAKAG